MGLLTLKSYVSDVLVTYGYDKSVIYDMSIMYDKLEESYKILCLFNVCFILSKSAERVVCLCSVYYLW